VQGAVELKSLFDVLVSDEESDKVPMQDGSKENILPTKNLKMTIDANAVLSSKTVKPEQAANLASTMEWSYNKNYVTKAELAMFDILAHNNWKRPIYFAVTVPNDNYIGLQKYLYNEGFALRLLPLQPKAVVDSTSRQEAEQLNTDAMYNNMINKFKWGNMKNASYLDPESTRMIAIIIKSFNQLAETLLSEGKVTEAKKTVLKAYDVIPDKNHLFYFVMHKYQTAELLYKVNEPAKANDLVEKLSENIGKELDYLISVKDREASSSNIQLGAYVISELIRITEANKQTALNAKLKNQYKSLESRLMGVMP
jgi:tetratricopeptide (TPR) repeat protein